jgi:hypothetical protein
MPSQGSRYLLPPQQQRIVTVDGATITDMGDGGCLVDFNADQQESDADPKNFDENLATVLSESVLSSIGSLLVEAIEEDKESRSDWMSILEKGIEALGYRSEPLDYPYKNASGIWSPALNEALTTFVARARAELLPVKGPAKVEILGKQTQSLQDRADRVEDYMNYYFTHEASEYYPETEQLFMWCGFEGSAFKKSCFNPLLNRPASPLIKSKDLIVNYGASNIDSCARITQSFSLNYKELKSYQLSGMYRKVRIDPVDDLETDPVEIKVDAIEGIKDVDGDHNREYSLYESHADLNLNNWGFQDPCVDESGLPVPYLVVLDQDTHKILALCRNWKEGHPQYKRKKVFTHFKYLPGFGFYGNGLLHIAGGAAYGATSCLRQMSNAATLSTFPGGVRMAGMRLQDNNIRVGPTEFKEIETGGLPIQQAIMPLPSKEPSPTLLQLKNDYEESIRRISASVSEPLSEHNNNAPVGTTLARLEESQKVQSSVMARLHKSLGEEFQCIYELLGKYMSDEDQELKLSAKELRIKREDFGEDLRIVPVSDPNLNSSTQRLLMAEFISQLADNHPDICDPRAALERVLRELKVQNIDEILPPPPEEPEPQNIDPLLENTYLTPAPPEGQTRPVKVFRDQDHQAHIVVHQLVANPQMPNPALDAHVRDHERYLYLHAIYQQLNQPIPDDIDDLPPNVQNQLAKMASEAATQHQQQMQQNQPPPPVDPGAAMMADVQMKGQISAQRSQNEAMKLQMESQAQSAKMQNEQQSAAMKMQLEQMKMEQENQQQMAKLQMDQIKMENTKQFEMMKLDLMRQIELMKAERALRQDEIKGASDHLRSQTELEKAHMSREASSQDLQGQDTNIL